jgi:ferritin-like metal-binding protein YciE
MASKEKTLNDLFHDTLRDIYYAEKKILKALPKMQRAAASKELKAAFLKHEQQTEVHVERLEQVFELIEKPARGKTCDAIEGIIAEGARSRRNSKACRPDLCSSGRRALRDNTLRHAQTLGH